MKEFFAGLLTVLLVVVLIIGGTVGGWFDTWFSNKVECIERKIDDATNYDTLKKVEDACRAMQASYESDRLTWEQYKDSENVEKRSWAEQAMMRANKTAATYNNYMLENSFVWAGNIPSDIAGKLEYLSESEA
jgi:hypothetical protein